MLLLQQKIGGSFTLSICLWAKFKCHTFYFISLRQHCNPLRMNLSIIRRIFSYISYCYFLHVVQNPMTTAVLVEKNTNPVTWGVNAMKYTSRRIVLIVSKPITNHTFTKFIVNKKVWNPLQSRSFGKLDYPAYKMIRSPIPSCRGLHFMLHHL